MPAEGAGERGATAVPTAVLERGRGPYGQHFWRRGSLCDRGSPSGLSGSPGIVGFLQTAARYDGENAFLGLLAVL